MVLTNLRQNRDSGENILEAQKDTIVWDWDMPKKINSYLIKPIKVHHNSKVNLFSA
ncbi:hypothetical protein JCM14036_25240 [Desulfotomaculum defluvii]